MSNGFAAIGLLQPKCNENVGSVLRAVDCYGAQLVIVEGKRYQRARTDTTKAYKHVPLLHGELSKLIPFDCIPVAVDLVANAKSLHSFSHPARAYYVFGPEDGTLGEDTLKWCAEKVYIPMRGCSNLAATVNVVLYDRSKKLARQDRLLEATKRVGWRDVK